jgi:hypothetical protein
MEQSPRWETDKYADSQKNLHVLYIEPKGSSMHALPVSGACPQPDQSSSQPPADILKIRLNAILP